MLIIIGIIDLICLSIIIYLFVTVIKLKKIKTRLVQTKTYKKISENVLISVKKRVLPGKINRLTPITIFLLMICLFFVSFTVFYSYLKVVITSIILSLPFFLFPILIIKILLNKEKADIIRQLPIYVVNIKSHIEEDNNIIGAIQRTSVEEPLKKYIDIFNTNVSRGMNVVEAFNLLKEEVNVKVFTDFVNSCEVCYLNGGTFNKVLEEYINIITKENIHKESAKEKAHSDVLTLIIMAVLNAVVVIMFVFANKEYAAIMRETFFGRLILNFNACSYIVIAYLVSRIYKEE